MLGPLLTFNLLKKVFFIIFNKSTHPENEKKKRFLVLGKGTNYGLDHKVS